MALIRPIASKTFASNIPLYWVNCGVSATNNNAGVYYDENESVTDLTAGNSVTGKYFSFNVSNTASYIATCNMAGKYHKFNLTSNTYSELNLSTNETFTVATSDKFIIWLD